MNERKVRFSLGIGIANAEQEEVFTLDQLGISDEDYETEEELQALLEEEWNRWKNEYVDGGISFED
jgi:hypothetical protein